MLALDAREGSTCNNSRHAFRWVPTLVSVMHGNNEVGILQDIEAIGQCCWDHSAPVSFRYGPDHGALPLWIWATCRSTLLRAVHTSFTARKGAGFLYVKDGHRIGAHIIGGSQERAMRGGTENLIGIIGLAKAH